MMTTLEKRLLALQQKIENLTTEVADLVALTSDSTSTDTLPGYNTETKPLIKRSLTKTASTQIGLNRFHQLAKESA